MASENIVPALISGGFGAGIGAIGVAFIQIWGHKSESRAKAADFITDAAGDVVGWLREENKKLHTDRDNLKVLVLDITDLLDELIPQIPLHTKNTHIIEKLHEINRKAKLLT